jgi:ankyrin repeat protein
LNAKGETALLIAVRHGSFKAISALLADPQTNVEMRNQQDESPLMLAALKGYLDLAKQLIARDADVNKPGWAPLHYAATKGDIPMIELLLDNDAYIDAESPNGTTPLMMAAQYGTPTAVKALLEAGADPSLKNGLGLSAIDFANRVSRADVAEVIARQIKAKQPKGTW